jgi:DNA-directed RNA polymerase alpha subunit
LTDENEWCLEAIPLESEVASSDGRLCLLSPDTPISVLDLPARAYNCLHYAGIETVADLCKLTSTEVLGLKNLGVTSLEHIRAALRQIGPRLKDDPVS